MNNLLMAFYGDDFTGSADAMEALTLNGVPTVLFLDKPNPALLKSRLKDVRAVGVAGTSRAMTPSQMDGELPGQFQLLKDLGVPLIHYKVCATFDSSATIGSIGYAADIAFRVIKPPFGVIVQGVPVIGRYVVFGNHFTTVGDKTYRLDRHPMMSRHPITPMDEGDLRLHFAKQTAIKVELIDVLQLNKPFDSTHGQFDRYIDEGNEIILFDTLEEKHLLTIGQLIHQKMRPADDLCDWLLGIRVCDGALLAICRYRHETGPDFSGGTGGPAGRRERLCGGQDGRTDPICHGPWL